MNFHPHVLYKCVFLAAGLVVFGILFQQLLSLLMLVLATVILAIPLSMIAGRLEHWGIARPIGALAGIMVGIGIIAGLLFLLVPALIQQGKEVVDSAPRIANQMQGTFHDITGMSRGEIGEGTEKITDRYVNNPQRIVGPLASIGLGVAGIGATLLLMILTAYYMSVKPQPLMDGLARLFPPGHRDHVHHILDRLRSMWIGWMQGVLLDMIITGVLLYIGLSLVGMEFALVFAVLSAILVLIPYFGSILGGLLTVLFALADSPQTALMVGAVYLLVQQIEGNVIIPLVMARTMNLHPVIIAIGVVVVGQLLGVIGLLMAVPILSLAVVLVEEVWIKPMEHKILTPAPNTSSTTNHVADAQVLQK